MDTSSSSSSGGSINTTTTATIYNNGPSIQQQTQISDNISMTSSSSSLALPDLSGFLLNDDGSDTSSTSSIIEQFQQQQPIQLNGSTSGINNSSTPGPSLQSSTSSTTTTTTNGKQQQQQQQLNGKGDKEKEKDNGKKSSTIINHISNSIANRKSNSSSSLMGGGGSNGKGDMPPPEEKKARSKIEEMQVAVASGNTTFFGNSLKSKSYGVPITQILRKQRTFLHIACSALKMHSLTFILDKDKQLDREKSLINRQNENLKTPLFICCQKGFYKGAITLIREGASPLLSNRYQWTPLHILASEVIKKVKYNPQTDKLIGYSMESLMELAQLIISQKSSIIGYKTKRGQTPLHLSIISGNVSLVNYILINSTPDSLQVIDDNGNSPLHLVAYAAGQFSQNYVSIAEKILRTLSENLSGEKLKDFIDEINFKGASALQLAFNNNNLPLIRLIVKLRTKAESMIVDVFFKKLNELNPQETLKVLLDQDVTKYRENDLFKTSSFEWLEKSIPDEDYLKICKENFFAQISDTLMHLYKQTNKSKDIIFQERVSMFKGIEYSELDISEASWSQNLKILPEALAIINSLPKKKTPNEKINTLNEATSKIIRNDANDLTPMFMYLIIKSQVDNIQSEFQFMDDFKDTPEHEQYLVLLSGSLDYLETLNVTLRNSSNQIMSLSGIIDRTLDNALSLCDELQNQLNSSGADQVEDIDEGFQIINEIILLQMLLTKLANRINNDPIYLPLKWSDRVLSAYHFKSILDRLGSPSITATTPPLQLSPQRPTEFVGNIPGYTRYKKGEVCVILLHPYPQMVYQAIEEKIPPACTVSLDLEDYEQETGCRNYTCKTLVQCYTLLESNTNITILMGPGVHSHGGLDIKIEESKDITIKALYGISKKSNSTTNDNEPPHLNSTIYHSFFECNSRFLSVNIKTNVSQDDQPTLVTLKISIEDISFKPSYFYKNSFLGNGAAIYIIDNSRQQYVNPYSILSVKNSEFTGFQGSFGTVIYSKSLPVYLSNSKFTHNLANQDGSAVWSLNDVVSTSCTFIENRSRNRGGVIFSNSTTYCRQCIFKLNSAAKSCGSIDTRNAEFHFSVFDSNQASFENGYGGALCNKESISVEYSIFTNNTAAYGGAISLGNSFDSSFNSFISNSANYQGGAIFMDNIKSSAGYLNLQGQTLFKQNNVYKSDEGGSAIYFNNNKRVPLIKGGVFEYNLCQKCDSPMTSLPLIYKSETYFTNSEETQVTKYPKFLDFGSSNWLIGIPKSETIVCHKGKVVQQNGLYFCVCDSGWKGLSCDQTSDSSEDNDHNRDDPNNKKKNELGFISWISGCAIAQMKN
eukprot:gene2237-2759_t